MMDLGSWGLYSAHYLINITDQETSMVMLDMHAAEANGQW